jgi:hypothetical protein
MTEIRVNYNYMNKCQIRLLLLVIFIFPLIAHSQIIDSMMNVYAENYPQEKVYVQFDKSVYNPGETIWYKAYIFTGADPSQAGKNFYTELSDAGGNIVQRKTAPVLESTASGSFDIPPDVKGSRLHFRAYTSWMLNFDTAFIYEKEIIILNGSKDSSVSVKPLTERYLQFFPEGGDMVAGLESVVAFKASDHFGLPINIKGVLKDASGKNLLEFNTEHDGLGKFILSPDKNDVFTAVWKDDLGIEHKTDLPAVKPSGVVLKLLTGNKKVFFSVARSSVDSMTYSHLTIIGHMHQHLVYKAKINLEESFMSGGTIPVEQLPSGVLQVTIFINNDQPVAERVIFVNNHDYEFSPQLIVTAKSVVKRGRNEIEIAVPDTLHSNLSVSITDGDADGNKFNDDNIISRLLLTGDVKGYVHNPYYYFSNSSDSIAQHLDLVMLTHGWRRFKWDQLAKGKPPVIKFPEQYYISAKAEVLGVDASHIAKDEFLNLILKKKDSSTQILQVPHLSGFKFGLTGLIFYDTAQAYYQFNMNRKLSNEAAIVFTTGLYNGNKKIKPMVLPYINWTAADSALLRKNRMITAEMGRVQGLYDQKVKTLETVVVKGREKTPAEKLSEKYTSGLFSSGDAHIFDLVNDKFSNAYPDIFTYLQGKVAGLTITNNGTNISMSWRGSTPGVYLNEMQTDVSQLKNIPVSDIALVKVFPPGSGVGFGGGGGGSIAVYTKKGGDAKVDDASFKGLDKTRIAGYSPVKEFYSPNYAQLIAENEAIDLRTTLYWNPHIITNKLNHRITVQFYNNDITKKIRIVLEGINENGKLARIEKNLQ